MIYHSFLLLFLLIFGKMNPIIKKESEEKTVTTKTKPSTTDSLIQMLQEQIQTHQKQVQLNQKQVQVNQKQALIIDGLTQEIK